MKNTVIFSIAKYANFESGKVDLCGINYYRADLLEMIIAKIQKIKPADYATFLSWLTKDKDYNGFYILGV